MKKWVLFLFHPQKHYLELSKQRPFFMKTLLLSALGFLLLLNFAQFFSWGKKGSTLFIFIISLVFSLIWGYLVANLLTGFVWISGKWVKGKASFSSIRSAFIYSCLPLLLNVLCWIGALFLFGRKLFLSMPGGSLLTIPEIYGVFLFTLLQVVGIIWSLILFLSLLGFVQKIELGKAMLNLIIAGLLLFVFSFFIALMTILSLFWFFS